MCEIVEKSVEWNSSNLEIFIYFFQLSIYSNEVFFLIFPVSSFACNQNKLYGAGANHQESATTPFSCHGVFTDRSIFSLNLCRIQIRAGASIINCNHKHGLMLTCRNDVDMFMHARPHCFFLTEGCSSRLQLVYFAGKNLKIDWSVRM